MADIGTVIWKEWKELLLLRGSLRGSALFVFIVPVAVLGVFLPWQTGKDWVDSPMVLISFAWIPLLMVTNVIADSFAGERERHTLETLLASRLPDRAILLGKVGAAILYAWGLTLLMLLLGLVTVNLAHGDGKILLYPAIVAFGAVTLSLLTAGLAAGVGVFISLRAATARQAQQSLSIPLMLLLFVPVFGFRALPPEWRAGVAQFFLTASASEVVLAATIALTVLDVVLLIAALARFQRTRLTFD